MPEKSPKELVVDLRTYADEEREGGMVGPAETLEAAADELERFTRPIDPIDLRTFPPVRPLSEVPETWRQTFIAKFVECPRAGYLYLKTNGGALTHPLAGGTLLHRAVETYIRHLLENGERMGDPETAKDILNDTLRESTDLTVSPDRFDSLRAMMFHMAEGLRIDPERVVFLETAVSIDVGGHTLTGTIDFGEYDERTRELTIKDWKSAFYNAARGLTDEDGDEYVPSEEDWPGTFQLLLYALAALKGSIAGGPAFENVETFRLQQIHPRQFWRREETMAYREAIITRETLLDWMLYLEAVVGRLEKAFETWEFPAVIGKHCDYCPASAECPIPASSRLWRGEIRTPEDAARALVLRESHQRRAGELWEAVKGFAKVYGKRIRYGRDKEAYWKTIEGRKVKSKAMYPGAGRKVKGLDALQEAVRLTEEHGIGVNWSEYVEDTHSSRLSTRTLTPAELDNEKGSATQ